ncbi:Hypothetical_protein [Hexamita inflata]|uniref:Hypothetical_protein n=1 Tax=Hexamita inflata TaxID=28002 RepID=A0AA86QET9_9EUKA|nr:Hypothetical protein HINF_LOCUS39369 [Hexamita inflata]
MQKRANALKKVAVYDPTAIVPSPRQINDAEIRRAQKYTTEFQRAVTIQRSVSNPKNMLPILKKQTSESNTSNDQNSQLNDNSYSAIQNINENCSNGSEIQYQDETVFYDESFISRYTKKSKQVKFVRASLGVLGKLEDEDYEDVVEQPQPNIQQQFIEQFRRDSQSSKQCNSEQTIERNIQSKEEENDQITEINNHEEIQANNEKKEEQDEQALQQDQQEEQQMNVVERQSIQVL